jgi:23S rRNA (adenine2503-C2)-methyltransferase
LIPFNDVAGLRYRRPTNEALSAFSAELRHAGISVKIRKRKGSTIDAACGQLRRRIEEGDREATRGFASGCSPG